MKLLDVLTAPWAIVPEKLHEIRAIYETHMRGEKLDLKVLKKKAGAFGLDADDAAAQGYTVEEGVAVIEISDVLTKNRTFFSYLFGGSSMRDIGDAFAAALEDAEVRAILLRIDSPGGTVDGTEELAAAVHIARGKKPIVALADGMMASAAYWIGAAADRVYIAGETTQVGSIGVVGTHIDLSEQDRMMGERWTEITAGKYKRIASAHRPLSDEGKAYLQEQVDEIYRVFVDSIAGFRGLSVEQTLVAANGKIFMGREAVRVGLADDLATKEQIINKLREETAMNLDEIKTKHADLYQAILTEGRTAGEMEGLERGRAEGYETGKAAGLLDGAEAERKRIQAIDEQALPGHEALVTAMRADGKSTAADVALAIVQAEKQLRTASLAQIAADAIPPLNHVAAPAEVTTPIDNLPIDQRAKIEWDKSFDLRAEFGDNFNAFLEFQKNAAKGLIRIYGAKK